MFYVTAGLFGLFGTSLIVVRVFRVAVFTAFVGIFYLLAPGDGLGTRDTVSGLDWLDLTASTSPSWWAEPGWRSATGPEVCDLFERHVSFPSPCPGSPDSLPYGEVIALLDLLHHTSGISGWVCAYYDDLTPIPPNPGLASLNWFSLLEQGAEGFVVDDTPTDPCDETYSFLVRATPVPPVPALPVAGVAMLAALLLTAPAVAARHTAWRAKTDS